MSNAITQIVKAAVYLAIAVPSVMLAVILIVGLVGIYHRIFVFEPPEQDPDLEPAAHSGDKQAA